MTPTTAYPPTARLGFVVVVPYQKDLEEKINSMLSRAVEPGRRDPSEEQLRETADAAHRIIDRDRRARGLPAFTRVSRAARSGPTRPSTRPRD